MKLEYFFFGLFALLLAATGMLAMHYRGELMYERRLSELARQAPAIPQAPAPAPAPAPVPAAAAPAADPAAAERAALARQLEQAETEKNLLSSQVRQMQETQKSATSAPDTSTDAPDLTATQLKIKETPAIARIKQYLPDQGFAVLDAGAARGLKPGQAYAVRRGHFIVANQIEIGETVDENESIAGVNASSLQPGETLKPGDEVIKWDQPSAPQ